MINNMSLSIAVLGLPLLSFISIGLFGRKIGTYGSMCISVCGIALATFYTFFLGLPNSFNFVETTKL
jgi:hypothetical protein